MHLRNSLFLCALATLSSPVWAVCSPSSKAISSLPTVITTAGEYCLVQDLAISIPDLYEQSKTRSALRIDTPSLAGQSVTINLNGHTLQLQAEDNEYASSTKGIDISGAGNVLIQNGTIQGFNSGINGASTGGNTLDINRVDIISHATGIYAADFDALNVSHSSVLNEQNENGIGIMTNRISTITVDAVDILSGQSGIVLGGGTDTATISNSLVKSAESSVNYGIILGLVANATIKNNRIDGFPVGLHFDSASAGTYSRMTVTVPMGGQCFSGGTAVGARNQCTEL